MLVFYRFSTYKIKQVDNNEDFKIRIVNHSPYNDYEWEYVNEFEDFSVQFDDAFEDYKLEFRKCCISTRNTQNNTEDYFRKIIIKIQLFLCY